MIKIRFFVCFILLLPFFSCKEKIKQKLFVNLSEPTLAKKADSLYFKDQYSIAKLYYDTLILINPTNGVYYYRRAISKYMLLDDSRGAINDFFQSITYRYKNKKGAFLGIAIVYRIERKYDSAIIFYDKSLELDSNYEKAKTGKEEVLNMLEQQE